MPCVRYVETKALRRNHIASELLIVLVGHLDDALAVVQAVRLTN